MVMDAARLGILEQQARVDLIEVFSSIQGEGPHVGERHLFVRFVHCDMHCRYCDTPLCHAPQQSARLERTAGALDFEQRPNGLPVADLTAHVEEILQRSPHQALAITGGEPLLQPWGVAALAAVARAAHVPALLETDGNLPQAFEGLRPAISILSLDWKLPSATGCPPQVEQHCRFLDLARDLECYVKTVFTHDTPDHEVLEAARTLACDFPTVPLVLQPCTPFGGVHEAPAAEQIARLHGRALQVHGRVLVIPQVHRLLGQP